MTKGMSSLRLFMRNGPRRTVSDGGGEASSSENDGAVAQNQQARQPLGPITEAVRNPPTHAVDQSIGGPPPPSPRGSKSDYHHSTNGRGKGRTISSHEQERFPHLENSESVANLNNNASDFSFNAVAPSASAPSNTKNNGKFSWHHRQGTHSRDASLDLSTPPRHSKQSTNVDAAAPSGNSLGGHQVLVGLPRAGSNGGGSVPSTPKSARAGSSNDSETGGSRSQHGTPSKTVSRSLKYGQQASSTNSGASGTTTVRSAVPQHNITRPAASYMQPVKSLIPQPIQQHFAVQHFGIEEDPKFWRDHNVQVLIRTRPISSSEQAAHGSSRCLKQESPHTVSWLGQPESRFTFDHVAGEIISQAKLFEVAGLPMVENCMSGYNSCMFAYGQTGSGKTHTMLGDIEGLDRHPSENRGMTPRVFEYLFGRIRMEQEGRRQEHLKFFCKCSFLEIYNEQITDLLEPSSTNLQMREDAKKGVYVENLSEFEVQGVHDVIQLLLQGAANRKVAATNMNRESSRSHSVFTCVVESKWESNSMTNSRYGRLHLVDLAGSERQKSSGAEGGRLKEAANINKSLSTLGLVIMILVDVANGKQRHVPYRDSKLTFLLQDSLGGNSKTIMIANVSPSSCCAMETLSTLKFAQRAKFIRNNAVINEDAAGDVIALRRQINELKVELDRLRRESLSRTPSLRLLPLQSGSIGRLDSEDLMEIDSGAAERSSPDSVNTSSKPKHNSTAVSADKKKSLEAVLAGALRREQSAEDNNKKLAAEIEQLNRLVRQREEDSQCSKMMLRFREEKIRRLEGITDNTIPTDSFYEKENKNLVDELQLLRGRLDRNPELTRFAMENIRLMEQLRSYQEFFDCGQKDALLEEMSGLRDQLLDTLDAKLGGEQRLTTPQKKALAPEFAALTRENELLLIEVESYRKELKECRDNLNSLVEANADMARQVDDLQATVKHLKTEHNQTETQKQDEHWQMNLSIRTQLEEQLQNALHEIDVLRRKVPDEEQVEAEATLQAQLQEQLKNALAELDGLRGRAEENDQTEVNVSMRTELQEQLTNALHELDNLRRQMQVLDEAKEQLVFAETVARRPHSAEAILAAAQETASSAQLTVRQIREETEELASQHKQSLTDIEKATLTWRDQELELRSRLRDAEQIIQRLTQPEERMHDVASEDGTCTDGQQEELETLRKTEMRHSEEMTQLRLELESIEKVVREEKEQRLAAEQKCEHLVSQLNAELSEAKQAEALVEALEGQQLFSLHELENLQAEHAETLTALKLYEEERNVRQGQFHNECVDADPAYHLLEHKLHRARKAKEEARRINIQFQEEKASQLARDKEREVIMSEVETQAALAITMLQSEILDLKEEISAAAETEANSSLQILQLRKELESVEQIVGQLEEQNRRLIDEHERQNVAAAESRIEKDKLLIRESEKKSMAAFLLVHEILSGLEQLKATKQMLDNECLEKTKSLSELEVVIDSLEQKIRRDRDELADISTRHRTLTEAHASQQSENDRLVRESELNKQELTMNVSSQREMQEAKFAVVETESKMAALQQQLDESSRTYSLLADQHRVLDNTQQRLREDYEHSQRQCAKLQVEKESAQAQCERLLEENAAIKSEEENSIQHSDRKAMVAFVALEHLTERMAELRATNERLEIALVSTEQETEQRTSALTTLQQELGQERHHSREMVSRFDLLNDKCQSLQEQYNHREEELKKLLGEVEDMERRNKLSERRCMAAFVLLEQTAEKMKSLKAENAGLERDVQGATDTGAHKDSMISSQQLQLEHEIQLRKDVASRHDILMEEHESLRSEHLRIETAIVDVKDQNSQKNAELHALQQQLEHELRQNTTLAERYQLLTEQYQKLRGDHERVLADHEVRLGEYASLVESKDRSIKVSDRKAMAAYVILEHLTDSRKDLREETARLARQIQEAEAQKENQLLVLRQELEINSHHYSEIEERQRLLMDANENLREEHMRSQAEHLKLLEEKCSIVENGERMLMLSERKTLAVSMALGQLSDSRAKLIEENEFLKREIQEKRTQNESQLLTLQAELERKVHRCSEIEDRQQLLTEAHERLRDEHRRSHESYENILRANAMVVDDRERTIRLLEKNTAVAFVVVAHLRDKGNDLKVENARLTREMSETAAQSETQRLALQQESERNINQSSEFEDRHMLLMGEHERLRTAYETSQGQYDRLLRAQENSQAEHERFRQKFEELQASHESLRAEYGESQLERERLLRLSASKDEEKHRLVRMAERKSMAAAVTVAQLARKKEVLEEEHARLAHEARQTRSALADVNDQQRTELANSCEKNAFLEREVSVAFLVLQHISNQQHELTVKTEKLTMDVEAAKRSIWEKNSEISVLRKQLELECDNNAKAVDQHLRLKDVNKMLHDELEILRAEGMSIVDIREKLVRQAEAKAYAAFVTLGRFRSANKDLETANENLKSQVRESLLRIDTTNRAITALEQQLEEGVRKNRKGSDDFEQLTDAHQNLLDEHGQLEATLVRTVAEKSLMLEEREVVLNASERKASAAFVLLEQLRNGSEDLLVENDSLKEELRELQHLCAEKDITVSTLQRRFDDYERRVQTTLETTEQQVANLETRALNVVTSALFLYDTAYVDGNQVSTSLRELETLLSGGSEVKEAASRLGVIESEAEFLLSMVTQLEEDNAEAQGRVERLECRVSSLMTTVDARERELKNAREERDEVLLAIEVEAARSKGWEEERAALTTDREGFQSKSLEKEKAVQDLRLQVQTLESNLKLADLRVAEMLTSVQALTVAKDEAELEKQRLAVSVENAEANCSQKERALATLQCDLAELHSRISEAEIREQSVCERMEEVTADKMELEAERADLEREIKKMKDEKAHLGVDVQLLNDEIFQRESTLLESFGKSQIALDKIDCRVEAMVEDLVGLETSKYNLEHVLESLESAASSQSDALEEKEFENVDLKKRLETAELKIAELLTALDASSARGRVEQELWEAKERKMQDEHKAWEAQRRDEIGELQDANANLEHEMASAKLASSHRKAALEAKEFEVVNMQRRLETAESQVSERQAAIESVIRQFQHEKDAWEEDKRYQERKAHSRDIEISEQIAAAEAKLLTTESHLKSAAEAVERLTLSKVHLEDEMAKLHENAKISQSNIDSQQDHIATLKAASEKLKVEGEEAQKKLTTLTELRDHYILSEMNWRSEREQLTQRLESLEVTSLSRYTATDEGGLVARSLPLEQSEEIQVQLQKHRRDNDALRAMVTEKDRTILSAKKEMEIAISNLKEAEMEMEKVHREKQRLSRHCLENNDMIDSISHKLRSAEEELWKRETRIEGCEAELQKVAVILSEWDVKMHVVEEEWRKEKEALAQELTEAKLDASEKRSEAAALLQKFQEGQATLREAEGLVDALVRANENAKNHAFDWQCEKQNLGIVQGWWMPERDRLVSKIAGLETDMHTQKQDMWMVCKEALVGMAETMNVLTVANQEVTILDNFLHEEMEQLLSEMASMKADVVAGLKIPRDFSLELESLCTNYRDMLEEARGVRDLREKPLGSETATAGSNQNLTETVLQVTSERDAARKQNSDLMADIGKLDERVCDFLLRAEEDKDDFSFDTVVGRHQELLNVNDEKIFNRELCRVHAQADRLYHALKLKRKQVESLKESLSKEEAERVEFVQISNDKIVRLTEEGNEYKTNLAHSGEELARLGQELKRSREVAALQRERISAAEAEVKRMSNMLQLSEHNALGKEHSVNSMILELEESRFKLARAAENLSDLKLQLTEAQGTVHQLQREQELNSLTINELDEKLLSARKESAFLVEKHDFQIRQWEEERGVSEDQLMEQLLKQNALGGQLEHSRLEKEATMLENSKLLTRVKNVQESHSACVHDLNLSQRVLDTEVSVLKQLQVELKVFTEEMNDVQNFVNLMDEVHADIEDLNSIARGLAFLGNEVRDLEELSIALELQATQKYDSAKTELRHFEAGRATILGKLGEISRKFETIPVASMSQDVSVGKIRGNYEFTTAMDQQLQAIHADIEHVLNDRAVLAEQLRTIQPRLAAAELEVEEYKTQLKASMKNQAIGNEQSKDFIHTHNFLKFTCADDAFETAITACHALVSDMPKSAAGLDDFQALRNVCSVHRELREEFEDMKEDILTLQAAMKAGMHELQSRNTDLEEELDEKRHALDVVSEEFILEEQELTRALDTLTMQMKAVENERDRFQTEIVVLSEQLEMAQTLADERDSVAAEARQVAELSKSRAEEKEVEARILGRSVEELERTVYALETQLSIVKQEAERQRITREDLEKELDVVRDQMRFMQSKIDEQEIQTLKDSQVAETSKTELDRVVIEMKSQQLQARESVESLQQECAEKDVQLRSCKAHIAELMLGAEKQANENQQKLKTLESMVEQLKVDDRKSSSACPGSGKCMEKSSTIKVKGAGSPFKCIGSALAHQRSSEIDEELSAAKKRIKDLEAVAASRQKEVFMLNTKLAEAESMTHDVVRDLLGVKMDIASYATLLNQQQMQRIAERARRRTVEAQEKEEEMDTLRKRLNEFIDERESWLEEINRRQAEAVAARVSAEKFRLKDQSLVEENEKFEVECLTLRRKVTDLEAEVKKLSGQQNLQQRIHHHAKIKDENNAFRVQVEDLSSKLRRMEMLFTRVNDELARYRSADGKDAFINFDEESRLQRELQTLETVKSPSVLIQFMTKTLQETEENRMQLAQSLSGLCTGIMQAAGVQRPSRDLDPPAAMTALQELQDRLEFLERELSDHKLNVRIAGEKRRISDLRELHTPVRNLSTNFTATQQLPSPVSSAR